MRSITRPKPKPIIHADDPHRSSELCVLVRGTITSKRVQ